MIGEPFASGNSLIHRTDPRIRLIVAVLFSFTVALCFHFPSLLTSLAATVILVLLARLNPVSLFRRLLLVNGFVLLLWLFLPWTWGGDPLLRISGLEITRQGVMMAAILTIKCNVILMLLVTLVSTMSFVTMGHALHRLRMPDRFVALFVLTYRYIFVIEQEYERIIRAVKIRGFVPRTTIHSYRTYAYIVGMLFVRATERAERVYFAMRCRGYNGRFHSLVEFPSSRSAFLFLLIMISVIAGIGYLEWR
jgi:cobalt/nickel transport system permease protein